jgi:hypothetical protein
MLSCFALWVNVWHIIKPIFPNFFYYIPKFFPQWFGCDLDYHIFSLQAPLDVCPHIPFDLMGIHLLQCTNDNKNICSSQHFCCHCLICWLSCGMRTITCTSFNHVQLFSFINPHCVHQRWKSHFN